MRISRVTKIRGHRVFRDFAWPGDLHSFGQFNLIYGWNGCGKTTLSSLFAHIEKGTNLAEGEVEFEIDDDRKCAGTTIAGTNLPPVRVFNRDFINATLQSAGGIAPIYFLGEDSVEKQAQVDQLKKQLAGANTEVATATNEKNEAETKLDEFCVSQARIIKGVLTSSNSAAYNNYNKAKYRQAAHALTAESAAAAILSDEQKALLQSQKNAQPKPAIGRVVEPSVVLSTLTQEVDALVARSIVAQTLDELTESTDLAAWVQRGLALHSGELASDTCRFCRQPLGAERRSALEAHFNDAFAAFQRDLATLLSRLKNAKQGVTSLQLPDASRFYESLVPEATATRSSVSAVLAAIDGAIGALIGRVEAKRDSPFMPVAAATANPEAAVSMSDAIDAFNTIIDKHNETSEDFKRSVSDACGKLEASYVAEAHAEYIQLTEAVKTAERALDDLKDKPGGIGRQIRILENQILEHQRPASELTTELRQYLGRDELQFEVEGTGYSLTRNGQPVSHLSEGERTAIAFLYFLKSLKDKTFNMENGVVVIDDPVSSLDANALFSAFGYMKERTKECGQLFVLTHNFGFFRQVKNWFHHLGKERVGGEKRPKGRFFLLDACVDGQGKRNSGLKPLDRLLREYESEYHFLFRRVYDEANVANGASSLEHHYGMPNVARRLVEAFLAFRYPDCPGDLAKRLDRVDFDSGKKTRILRLLNTYSHSSGIAEPEHDPSVLAETRPVLGEVLEMIKAVDPTHYAGMEQLLNGKEASA